MRESSIRLCQAHLDLTADAAAEAFIAAASIAATTSDAASTADAAQATSAPSTLSQPASPTAHQRGSETGPETGSKRMADISGALEADNVDSPKINASNRSSSRRSLSISSSGSSGRRSSSSSGGGKSSTSAGTGTDTCSAVGAVVKAACLVAAQGLMDPNKDVRLAGADLARSALSLWSSTPAAVVQRSEDKDEAGALVVDATAMRRSSDAAKSRSDSAEDVSIVAGDGGGSGEIVGSDDGAGGSTIRKSDADDHGETKELLPPPRSAQSDSAKTDSSREGLGSAERNSVSDPGANTAAPKARAAVPLRDLRWGLELVLACVAPYLTNTTLVPNLDMDDGDMPTMDGSTTGSVGEIDRRRSASPWTDSPLREDDSDDTSKHPLQGALTGDGGDGTRDDTAADESEELARPADSSPQPGDGDDEEGRDDGGRSLLALCLVDFACRHPDIGTALVSSVLTGWIPCLVRWGCNTPPSGSPVDSNQTKVGPARSVPRSPRCAPFTAGEAAASEALASGAIEMIAYMVRNFPLLPLSDFSADRLVAAAEGGMAFAGRTRASGASDRNGTRRDGVERTQDGDAVGGWAAAAAGWTGEGRGRGGQGSRRNRRSSTNGRAQKAGEALMLELFLRTSGGGGHGGLDLGLDCCLDNLLPALNTSRGINFLGKTAASAETRRLDQTVGRLENTRVEEAGQGKGGLEEGRNSCGRPSEKRASSSTAREFGVPAIQWPSQRRPYASKVEVRQRLELPPAPPTASPPADGRLFSGDVNDGHSAAPENERHEACAVNEGDGDACHPARYDTAPGMYPHMSDSSSAGGLSASTGKSAAVSVLSGGGGGGAAAPGGVDAGHESSSGVGSFSDRSRSSSSLEDGLEADVGSRIGSTATSRKSRQGKADKEKKAATATAVERGSIQDGGPSPKHATAAAESSKNSKKVFPILSFGGKRSNGGVSEERAPRNGVENQSGLGNATAATEDEMPAATGETKAKQGRGGFMSKLFGRS